MGNFAEKSAAMALASGLALGVSGCDSSKTSVSNGLPPTEVDKNISQYCDKTPAYEPGTYIDQVGNDLLRDTGTNDLKTVKLSYVGKAEDNSNNVAKAVAGNLLGQAVIFTIIGSEKGTTTTQTAQEAGKLFDQITVNNTKRRNVCATVIARIFQTPLLRPFQPETGKANFYNPEYTDAKTLKGLKTTAVSVTSPIQVFGLKAVSNSSHLVIDTAIANNWGITTEGGVLQTAHNEGTTEIALNGAPVTIDKNGKAVPVKPINKTGQAPAGIKKAGTSGGVRVGEQGCGTGAANCGGGSGDVEGNQGPVGHGNGGGGSTPVEKSPVVVVKKSPVVVVPPVEKSPVVVVKKSPVVVVPPVEKPPVVVVPPVVVTPPPPPETTTPPPPKGTQPPCVSNPPYVICP